MPCPHGRRRSRCKECGGSGLCEHGRVRSICKYCGGSGLCEHGRQHSRCKECGGASICEHGRERCKCKECGGGGHVTILEATEIEELDGEEEPHESALTVKATTKLAVGTRLLVRWESGWESGVVGDCTAQVGGVTPAMLHWVDYDDGESHLHDLSTLRVMLERTSSTHCELVPDTAVGPRDGKRKR